MQACGTGHGYDVASPKNALRPLETHQSESPCRQSLCEGMMEVHGRALIPRQSDRTSVSWLTSLINGTTRRAVTYTSSRGTHSAACSFSSTTSVRTDTCAVAGGYQRVPETKGGYTLTISLFLGYLGFRIEYIRSSPVVHVT